MSLRILAVRCPCGATAPDHFDGPSCGREPLRPALIRSILARERADERHADGRLTVTRFLSCPRQAAICDFIGITFDPKRFNNMHRGTIIHAELARWPGPGETVEDGFEAATIGGVQYSGRADLVRREGGRITYIEDYKDHNESTQGRKRKDAFRHPNDEDAQLNLLRIGFAQKEEVASDVKLMASHVASVSKNGPPPDIPSDAPSMTEEELLAYRPKGGVSSVRDHIEDWGLFHQARTVVSDVDEVIAKMPLRGQSQFGGKGCDYCVARETCDALEAGR